MNPEPDDAVIRRILSGGRQEFGQLYEAYKDSVYGYCLRLLGDRNAAEDATHSTFLKALESIHTLDTPSAFRFWLFTIARNKAYGQIRRTRRNGTTRIAEESDEPLDESTPHELASSKELVEIVQSALGKLKAEYREVMILREYEHLSYSEIAAVTGDTESSVKSRIFKARKALTVMLEPFIK